MGNQQRPGPGMQQPMQRPMLQAPQKPTFATVPDAINIEPFDASKYAANIQQPMQRAFELQKNVADQREAQRQQVMAYNAQKQQQYEQQLQAYNQQMNRSKYPQQQNNTLGSIISILQPSNIPGQTQSQSMYAGTGPMGSFKEQKPVYGNVMQSRPESTGQAQSGFGFNIPGQMQSQSMYAGPEPTGVFKQQEQFYGGNVMQSRPTSTGQAQSGSGFSAFKSGSK